MIRNFINALNNNPDYLVIDIGAHIGVYSLIAARMGNCVLAIEPFIL
jgi:predicted RNA methylase